MLNAGFTFEKGETFKGPGFEILRIVFSEDFDGGYFNPRTASLRVASTDGTVCQLLVTHPWNGPPQVHACEGRLILEDWRGKYLHAYLLGGTLSARSEENVTEVMLTSEAPIFRLNPPESDEFVLANRLQMEMARIRALFQDDARYHKVIASLTPGQLYASCLDSLSRWYETRPAVMRNTRIASIVNDAIKTYKAMGRWPDELEPLESMFHYPERTNA